MATLVDYTAPNHDYPISDGVIAGTTYKRKALWLSLYHPVQPESGVNLRLLLKIVAFAVAADGSYGAELTGPQFNQNYESTLRADDSTLVDADTGAVLAVFMPGQSAADRAAVVAALPAGNVMLQTKWFEQQRDTGTVAITPMVQHHIAQADALGRFA